MRLPVLAAVVLALVAAPATAIGAPVAPATSADAATAQQTTISGTVSYLNGTPVSNATVLVGNESMLNELPPEELRELAADPPVNVATATTNASGAYSLTVNDSVEAEAVIALSPDGVSPIRRFQPGTVNLTIRTTEPLTFQSSPVTSEPGGRATVTFTLEHTGDQPVEGLKLTLGSLPDGWNVASTDSETATYHGANRTFTWGTVEPGETVAAELKLFVAIEAIDDEAEAFTFPMFAGSSTHPVDAEPIQIAVRYPTERTQTELPGFGAPAVLAALAVAAVLAVLRRRS